MTVDYFLSSTGSKGDSTHAKDKGELKRRPRSNPASDVTSNKKL